MFSQTLHQRHNVYPVDILVTGINEGDYEITHLRKSDSTSSMFVAKDSTDKYGLVSKEHIIRILPAPRMDNRERKHFPHPIPEAN